jgi:hypothetical protein
MLACNSVPYEVGRFDSPLCHQAGDAGSNPAVVQGAKSDSGLITHEREVGKSTSDGLIAVP